MIILLLALVVACEEKPAEPTVLSDPEGVAIEQIDASTVRLSWKEVTGAVAYDVFIRPSTAQYYVKPTARLTAPASSYTFTEIPAGASYYFGVQALGASDNVCSRLIYSEMLTIPAPDNPDPPTPPTPPADAPTFSVTGTLASSAYIGITYTIGNTGGENIPHGICFGEQADPMVADGKIDGPVLGGTLTQVVPSTLLAYGKTFHIRPWATVASGTYYGPDSALSLGEEPSAIHLTWSKVTASELPAAISLYETTSTLNGRAFHAWYAIADCTGDVVFKVQYPSALSTIESQFGDNCLVLVNGSVFGKSKSIGMAITDGQRSDWRAEADGQYWGNSKLLQVTRATFGVDAAGHPSTCWSGLPDASHIWYYDRPLTTIAGEAAYPVCTASHPAPALEWSPVNAIAGGPMLLHGGICPTDLSKSAAGFYMTNYELWADDIFATSPDRTAVGYTADGKVVLFICDGRISASQGASVVEVAAILRDLGCVGAVNLDGGGSTGMMVRGLGHINDQTGGSRKVCTTLGFFRK